MFEQTKALCQHFLNMGIPCFDLIVYKDGACVFRHMGGYADPENKIPTTSTIAAIAASSAAAELPETAVPADELANGLTIPRLLVLAGICKSTSDGRRLIQGGAVSLNDVKITDVNHALTAADFADGAITLRAGKKNFRKVVVK